MLTAGAAYAKEEISSKSSYQQAFCDKFEMAQDTVDVETIFEQMEASRYKDSIREFWTTPACNAPLKNDTPVPIIFNTASNPKKNEFFPKTVREYFVEDHKDPETWLKAINTPTSDGYTFLDYLQYNIQRGFYSVKPSKDAALRIVAWLCKNGGVYSKYPNTCNPNEDAEAVAALKAQANGGDIAAQKKLGHAYEQGELGLRRDTAEALRWYIAVAKQGDREMQKRIASLYFFNPVGFPIDGNESIKWYERIGDAESYRAIGDVYYRGLSRIPVNGQEALKAWKKAADLGDEEALYRLGEYFTKAGDFGEAKGWFEKYIGKVHEPEAISKGQACIALLYIQGGNGLKRNYAEALSWIRKTYGKRAYVWPRIYKERDWLKIAPDLTEVLRVWEDMSQHGNVDAELIMLRYRKNS